MSQTIDQLARANIVPIRPYVPGKPVGEVMREYGVDHVVKLASNESSVLPSPAALAAMLDAVRDTRMYPEYDSYDLRHALAAHWGLSNERFGVFNGVAEALPLLAEAFLEPGDEVVFGWPSFSTYVLMTKLTGAVARPVPLQDFTFDLDGMGAAVTSRTKMVIVCNPNNPTGTIVTGDALNDFVKRLPEHVVVLIDEAYSEYVDDPAFPDCLDLLGISDRVVVMRTFSKAYALAALRIGYVMADPAIIALLDKVRQPFNVSAVAQAAAEAALGDQQHLARTRRTVAEGREKLRKALVEMGLQCVPTSANFILVDTGTDSAWVSEQLLQRGVAVRPGYQLDFPTHLRVTVGTEAEIAVFLQALREVLSLGRVSADA
ncbi:MAG: histidinol-phosphate transaminase [Armatimonadota bacterium]